MRQGSREILFPRDIDKCRVLPALRREMTIVRIRRFRQENEGCRAKTAKADWSGNSSPDIFSSGRSCQILFFPLADFVFECEHHIYTCKDKYVSPVTQGSFEGDFLDADNFGNRCPVARARSARRHPSRRGGSL